MIESDFFRAKNRPIFRWNHCLFSCDTVRSDDRIRLQRICIAAVLNYKHLIIGGQRTIFLSSVAETRDILTDCRLPLTTNHSQTPRKPLSCYTLISLRSKTRVYANLGKLNKQCYSVKYSKTRLIPCPKSKITNADHPCIFGWIVFICKYL